jgi:Uma2 family endonuclease
MNFELAESELPMRIRLERPMTDERLMRFAAEIEPLRVERDANGELIVMSPTGLEGSGFNSEIITDLTIWARQDGRGKVFDSSGGFTLPDDSMRIPDAAWLSWQRWNALPRSEQKKFGRVVPEFIIELRSETDRLPPLQAKMNEWVANGVDVAWLIDPEEKSVTIYRPGDQPEHLGHPTSVQGTGPIAGFELVMARIWE